MRNFARFRSSVLKPVYTIFYIHFFKFRILAYPLYACTQLDKYGENCDAELMVVCIMKFGLVGEIMCQ